MPHVPLTPDLGAVVSFEGAGVRLPKLNRRKVGRSRNRLKRIRGDVAQVLADCAAAGCGVEELEVGHADLEDVFLQLVSDQPALRRAEVGA